MRGRGALLALLSLSLLAVRVSSGSQARLASGVRAGSGVGVARAGGPAGADVLKEQLASVQASEAQVNGLLKSFQKGIKSEQAYEVAESDKAKKLAMSRNYFNSQRRRLRVMAVVREKRRRIEVNRCVSIIKGGRDAVYMELMNLFAQTPTEEICPVFKAFDFPDLKKHGFHESFFFKYANHGLPGEAPATDGSEILFFRAAKASIWRCMCEEKSQPLAKAFKVRVAVGRGREGRAEDVCFGCVVARGCVW